MIYSLVTVIVINLAIVTNIPVLLMTGFVAQGHIL